MDLASVQARILAAVLLGANVTLSAVADEPAANASDTVVAEKQSVLNEQIANWIAELDANEYLTRETATRRLLDAGEASLDPLLAAANGERPEPAERAIWVLRRLGRSDDNELAVAALERLVQLRDRPQLVERAQGELAERAVIACQQRLKPLGAEVLMQPEAIPLGDGETIAHVLHVRLGENWHGTTDDLKCLTQLPAQRHFRLEGPAVDDAAVALFERKEKLSYLHLKLSRVSVAAVDSLKARHPETTVYVTNHALLGVACKNHPAGVVVNTVQAGTAAAVAGVVQGDVITALDGKALPDFDRLTARIAQHQPGDQIEVEVLRGESRMKFTATLGARPEAG